jgi:hypothetical protein
MAKWKIVAMFAVVGLLGPVFRLVVFRPVESFTAIHVVQSITLLIWPAQVLGVMETSLGTARAGALAISANVLLFAVVGVIVALVARRRPLLWLVQLTVLALVTMWAHLWRAFDAWWALAIALAIYSAPFAVVRRTRIVELRTRE